MDQVAVAGISRNINIQCNLGRQETAPFWIINGSILELFSIPQTFLPGTMLVVNGFAGLTIPVVTTDLDGVTFQCGTYNEDGMIVLGSGTRLIVLPSKYSYFIISYIEVNNIRASSSMCHSYLHNDWPNRYIAVIAHQSSVDWIMK